MTNEDVQEAIKANIHLQIYIAGIRQALEEKMAKKWVGLTKKEKSYFSLLLDQKSDVEVFDMIVKNLKEKNT